LGVGEFNPLCHLYKFRSITMRKITIGFLIVSSLIFANSEANETKESNQSRETNATTWKSKPLEVTYTLDYDKNTTCLVRNILVYKEPKWVAEIEVRNGKSVYFSSPKSMFEFYHRPGKWFDVGVKSERDFSKIVVTDYETLKAIDGEKAFYVYGSRATSPAGDDLPAFATKEGAEKFAEKYNGKKVMEFEKVSDALIRLLNGRI
jgi:nitrous oxide reductase accessory protein NosL